MFTFQKLTRIIIPVLVLAVIAGCTGGSAPTESADSVNTMVAATFQAMTLQAPLPTAPATPVPPTATLPAPTPNIPAPAAAVRLNFAIGSTFLLAQGTLQPGQSQDYVLDAMQGQPMIAMVDSVNHDVTFGIGGQDGTLLLAGAQALNSWQGLLPSTQDYFITIHAGASAENYTMSVTIAARIQFAAGATSSTKNGSTVGGYNVTYVLRASAGQTMNLNLTVPSGTAALTVWGFTDGQPYLRAELGQTTFSMVLPSTQDYIVAVSPQGGTVVNYSMTVQVP